MATAVAAGVGATTGYRAGQIAPAPQIREDSGGMTAEQAAMLREAEANAKEPGERTMGTYVPKEGKVGKITHKPWYIIDPRTSAFVPYWDALGTVRCCTGAQAHASPPRHLTTSQMAAGGPLRRRVRPSLR